MPPTRSETDPVTGFRRALLYFSTAMVNNYYFYFVDEDFGPCFLKFCSYFPFTARLCLNGHEYAKRQLPRRGIEFEALDNGIRSCADSAALQAICRELGAERIDALLRKWLARLPHPFTSADRQAGYLRAGPAPGTVGSVRRRRASSRARRPANGSPRRADRSTLEGPMRRRLNLTQTSSHSAAQVT